MSILICFVGLVSVVSGMLAWQAWQAPTAWWMVLGFGWVILLVAGLVLVLTVEH